MELNAEQLKVVTAPRGNIRLIAGAGSGKTTVLINRIIHLVEREGLEPTRIVAITFTRKAAGEMRRRLEQSRIGERLSRQGFPWMGTIHSLAWRLWHREQPERWRVLAEGQGQRLRWSIGQKYLAEARGFPLATWMARAPREHESRLFPAWAEFYREWRQFKESNHYIEFDDMVPFLLRLWQGDESALAAWQSSFDSLLVDEFQDTSADQVELLRTMLTPAHDFLAVGDDWQSIYGFRQAEVKFFVDFKKYFPKSRSYRLERNYRSSRRIVSFVNGLLTLNRKKVKKRMKSMAGLGPRIHFCAVEHLQELPERVNDCLEREEVVASGEVAVLARTNELVSLIQKNLPAEAAAVQVMTVHKSKGLEFDSVIVAGIGENIFPHRDAILEEERRLLFVAASRAKNSLTCVLLLSRWGGDSTEFIRELGISYLP